MTKNYKWLLGIIVVLGSLALVWGCLVWAPNFGAVDTPSSIVKLNTIERYGLPKGSVQNISGGKIGLESLRDRNKNSGVLVFHFWASWCGPCVEELPTLIEFAKKFPGVYVAAVAEDPEIQDSVKFYSKFGDRSANFEVVFDPNQETALSFGTEKLPETFIFCPDGKFLQKFGAAVNWSKVDYLSYVRACAAKVASK